MTNPRYPDFEAYVHARWPNLLRYGLLLTGNRPDAEDLVQEALVRTGAAWARIRRVGEPEAYVRRTMARLHVSFWRKVRREHLGAEPPDRGTADPGHVAVDGDVGVWNALRDLPTRQRAVLVLRYYEGLSEAEIADRLGVSRGTVKSQASRALAKLKESLAGTGFVMSAGSTEGAANRSTAS